MNSFTGIGRIVNDLEVKMTQGNKAYCKFAIAVNRKFKNKEGKYDADFIDCIVWEQRADFLNKYAGKGSMVAISGELQTNIVEKNGTKTKYYQVNVNDVQLLNNPKKEVSQEQLDDTFGTENGTAKTKDLASNVDDSFY